MWRLFYTLEGGICEEFWYRFPGGGMDWVEGFVQMGVSVETFGTKRKDYRINWHSGALGILSYGHGASVALGWERGWGRQVH